MDIVCNINYNIVTHIIRLILQVILPAEQVRQAELVCLGVDNCWCWDSFWVQNFLQGRCSTSQGLGPSAAGTGKGLPSLAQERITIRYPGPGPLSLCNPLRKYWSSDSA